MRPSVIYKVAVRLGAGASAIITAFSVYNHLKFEYFLIEDTFFNERLGSLSYFVTMLSFTAVFQVVTLVQSLPVWV